MDLMSSKKIIFNGANDLFASRQQKLFDKLSNVEKNYNKNRDSSSRQFEINSNQLRAVKRDRNNETRNFQGKESIFKRPELPAPRTNYCSIPDYHRNPNKWVKYDLDNVKNKDMSDKSNTQAALSFLHDLKQRKTKNNNKKVNKEDKMDIEITNNNNSSSTSSRISFKKPSKNNCKNETVIIDDNNDKPVFRNSKVILPEYVVGQKRVTKIKKDKIVPRNIVRTKELKLDHLQDNDDDDED